MTILCLEPELLTNHLESSLTFHILPGFCTILKQCPSVSNFVNQAVFTGHHGLGFWEKLCPAHDFGQLSWGTFRIPFKMLSLLFKTLFCSASLTHFEIQLRSQCCSQRPFKNTPGMSACYTFSLWRNKRTKFIKYFRYFSTMHTDFTELHASSWQDCTL